MRKHLIYISLVIFFIAIATESSFASSSDAVVSELMYKPKKKKSCKSKVKARKKAVKDKMKAAKRASKTRKSKNKTVSTYI